MTATISVIIPTRNERDSLAATVDSVRRDARTEVVIVDGGSSDGTLSLARDLGDTVIESGPGRSIQLTRGAAVARGDVLLFLHADTRLSPRALLAIRAALRRPNVVGGAFSLRVDSPRRSLRVVSSLVNFRTRVFGLPYGDQAIFVTRSAFDAVGGFQPLEIMEDVDLVRRLRKHGKLCCIGRPVQTSDRRWQQNGVLRTTAVNVSALIMFGLSFQPQRIRRFYDARLRSGRSGPSTV